MFIIVIWFAFYNRLVSFASLPRCTFYSIQSLTMCGVHSLAELNNIPTQNSTDLAENIVMCSLLNITNILDITYTWKSIIQRLGYFIGYRKIKILPLEHQMSSLDTLQFKCTHKAVCFVRTGFKGTSVSYKSCILCNLFFTIYYPQFAGNEMHGAVQYQGQVFGKNQQV